MEHACGVCGIPVVPFLFSIVWSPTNDIWFDYYITEVHLIPVCNIVNVMDGYFYLNIDRYLH